MFENISALWKSLLVNNPFPLHDDSGLPLYPDRHQRFHFDQLHADWLFPMMMQNKVIGFLTLSGSDRDRPCGQNDLYFLRQIAAHAAVCINTCHLYLHRKKEVELLKAVADQAAVAINKAQLSEMAITDSLSGLLVRRYYMVKFQEELHIGLKGIKRTYRRYGRLGWF